MKRATTSLSVLAIALLPLACAPERQSAVGPKVSTPALEPMDDAYETPPPRGTVSEVMRAKLSATQAILEGLTMGDLAQVEVNAVALKGISESGEWMTQDSPAYFAFSARFREVCDDMVAHARTRNLSALAGDYAHLTSSCVACHEYLRHEREVKDLPGRISFAETARNDESQKKGLR